MQDTMDTGWAWVVLAACSARAFMVIGLNKAFGLFFIEYVKAFNTTSSMVSSIISTQQVVFSVSSFLILTVGNRYISSRVLVILGSITMAMGYIVNAVAPNVYILFLSQGFLFGFGQAAASGPSVILLNTYFDQKRGLANSISNSLGSLGGLLLPLLIQGLLEIYGLFGTQLIIAGMLLNIVVSGALMRPRKRDMTHDVPIEKKIQVDFESERNNYNMHMSADDIRIKLLQQNNVECTNNKGMNGLDVQKTLPYRLRTFSENLHEYRPKAENGSVFEHNTKLDSLTNIFGSFADISTSIQSIALSNKVFKEEEEIETKIKDENEEGKQSHCACLNRLINFSILRSKCLLCTFLVGFLTVFASRLQNTYIPPYAKDHGISRRNISYLVTIMGACDFIGRFGVAWIADSKRVQQSQIIASSLIMVAIATFCNSLLETFPSFIAYSVVYGLFGGIYNTMLPILLVDAVGAKNLSTALGFILQVHGISISGMAPILGYIRDSSGSYVVSFYVMGVGLFSAATILLFVLPKLKSLEIKKKQNLNSTESSS